jgi:nicotinamidase-related amidase
MNKALLILDVQKAFDDPKWGIRNNLDAEENIKTLLTKWRENKYEVFFIQHTSKKPHSIFHPKNKGFQIKDIIKPHEKETVLTKEVNSAFIGTSLQRYLNNLRIKEVVITGLTTPHCVSTTTRMSGNLGFETYLLSDATAAFGLTDSNGTYMDAQTVHDVSLATIHNEFATVLSTKDFIERHIK